jgi:hypothetical protein
VARVTLRRFKAGDSLLIKSSIFVKVLSLALYLKPTRSGIFYFPDKEMWFKKVCV